MLKSRNDLSHIYDEEQERKLLEEILVSYIPELARLLQGIEEHYGEELYQIS